MSDAAMRDTITQFGAALREISYPYPNPHRRGTLPAYATLTAAVIGASGVTVEIHDGASGLRWDFTLRGGEPPKPKVSDTPKRVVKAAAKAWAEVDPGPSPRATVAEIHEQAQLALPRTRAPKRASMSVADRTRATLAGYREGSTPKRAAAPEASEPPGKRGDPPFLAGDAAPAQKLQWHQTRIKNWRDMAHAAMRGDVPYAGKTGAEAGEAMASRAAAVAASISIGRDFGATLSSDEREIADAYGELARSLREAAAMKRQAAAILADPKKAAKIEKMLGGKITKKKPRVKTDAAVEKMRLYLGAVEYSSAQAQQKLYTRVTKAVRTIASKTGADPAAVWDQIAAEAAKLGEIRPIPGVHI